MIPRPPALALLILVAAASQVGAQRLAPSTVFSSTIPASTPSTPYRPAGKLPAAPDYRWEGVLIGGIEMGAFSLHLALAFCGDGDSGAHGSCLLPAVEGFAIGATIGTVVGGIIGGAIPKHRAPADSSAAP